MIGKTVTSEIALQLLCDLAWKLHHRVQPHSFTFIFQHIESQKTLKTLRSAERAPIPSLPHKDRAAEDLGRWPGDRFGDRLLSAYTVSTLERLNVIHILSC